MGGKNSSITVGYEYRLSVLMVLSRPLDAITEVIVGERTAWTGNQVGNGDVYIDAPDLFGGDSREGGVQGTMTVSMGTSLTQDSYLVSQLGPHVPAFYGKACLIFKDFLWSSINPYFKSPWIRARRIFSDWSNGVVWYPERAMINGLDMNPAHIIYQCITDIHWGMGYSPNENDDTNFRAIADRLYAEGFGLSFIWDQELTVEETIQIICNTINAGWDLNTQTGKFQIKLIRDDYDIDDLLVLDPSNISNMQSFQRVGWGELANQVIVKYTDREQNEQTVNAENLAAIESEGVVIPSTKEYLMVREKSLAERLAARDLATSSTPLAKTVLITNRVLWDKSVGDPVAVTWPERGIVKVAFRIVSINKGTLADGKITAELVEDVFGLPESTYLVSQPGGWTDPIQPPAPVIAARVMEAPYWDVVRNMPAPEFSALTPNFAFGEIFAVAPVPVNYGFEIWEGPTSLAYEFAGNGEFTPTGTLNADIDYTTNSITLNNPRSLNEVEVGKYAVIEGEYVSVTSINPLTAVVGIGRGVLDTVPKKHSSGARVYFAEDNLGYDPTEYSLGLTEHYKALTRTPMGVLPLASATDMPIDFIGRAQMPYPPGNFRINTLSYPENVHGEIALSWAHRDRLSQTVALVPYSVGSIGPEPGVVYNVKVTGELNAIINTTTPGTTVGLSLDDERLLSGVYTAGTNALIRSFGLNKVSSAISTELAGPYQFSRTFDLAVNAGTLMHFDGTSGSTTMTDSAIAPHTFTAFGDAQLSTAQSVFGGSSLLLDGTGDYVQTTTNLNDFIFGSDDFTIECWVKTSVGNKSIIDFYTTSQPGWQVFLTSGGNIQFYVSTSILISAGSVTDGNWHHVAVCRSSAVLRIFIDGTLNGSVGFTQNLSHSSTVFAIGGQVATRNPSYDFNGYIDEVRVLKGVGVYSANFTVPTAPLPDTVAGSGTGGWLGASFSFGTQKAKFVNNAGSVTIRDYDGGWNALVSPFAIKSGVYQSMVNPDSYIGWGISILDPMGVDPVSSLSKNDTIYNVVDDRRHKQDYVYYVFARECVLIYFPQSRSANRRIYQESYGLRRVKVSDVTTGPLPVTRLELESHYLGITAQFNSFTGQYLAKPSYNGFFNLAESRIDTQRNFRTVIFGTLLYFSYIGASSSVNTAGKTIDMTNILTAHIDVNNDRVDMTKVYSVDSSGGLTLISTRSGAYVADQITSTLGVEAVGTGLSTVNILSGAFIANIATLPAAVQSMCGDVPNGCVYIMCANKVLYKYDSTGTLLASIGGFTGDFNNVNMRVSANKIYIRSVIEVDKGLTTIKFNQPLVTGSGATQILYTDPTLSEMYGTWLQSGVNTNGLLDDAGLGDAVNNAPTLRVNDTLTIELESQRGTTKSYTKHNITVKRQGMGLRMGESMGGI